MSDEEIGKVEDGVVLLPVTAGAIVLGYNLDGIDDLKLSREAYTGIFLGKITKWSDPIITACNEGVELPDKHVTVVTRSDTCGTTFILTKHFSDISEDWKNGPGTRGKPRWPTPAEITIRARGNAGITQQLESINGSIGYIEFAFADKAGVPVAHLENKAGKISKPTIESAQAALTSSEFPENMILWLPDPEGNDSYPSTTYTWILCYDKYADPAKSEALKTASKWCLTECQIFSAEMGHIPLPAVVADKVLKKVRSIH